MILIYDLFASTNTKGIRIKMCPTPKEYIYVLKFFEALLTKKILRSPKYIEYILNILFFILNE